MSLEPPWQTGEEVAEIYAVSTPGPQLFAAINVWMRSSCGCASLCCVSPGRGAEMEACLLEVEGPRRVSPGKLLLLQGGPRDAAMMVSGAGGAGTAVGGLAAGGYSLCLDFSPFSSLSAGERGLMRL